MSARDDMTAQDEENFACAARLARRVLFGDPTWGPFVDQSAAHYRDVLEDAGFDREQLGDTALVIATSNIVLVNVQDQLRRLIESGETVDVDMVENLVAVMSMSAMLAVGARMSRHATLEEAEQWAAEQHLLDDRTLPPDPDAAG